MERAFPIGQLEAGGLGDEGQAQTLCERAPENRAVGVAALLADEDQVGRLALDGLRQDLGGRDEVGARGRVVRDENGPVRSHGERLSE